MSSLLYKVVEVSTVTEESLEKSVNEWVTQGWQLDTVHYVTQPSSRRPVMAYLYFTRETSAGGAE